MGLKEELGVPVNPEYDFDRLPEEQFEFVNPVHLSNKLIQQTNYAIEQMDRVVSNQKRLARLRVDLDKAEAAREDFEAKLLHEHPAPAADRKSNKLLDSYLRRAAHEAGLQDKYELLLGTPRHLKREIILIEAEIDGGRQIVNLIKVVGEHEQTHLSYVKSVSKGYPHGN